MAVLIPDPRNIPNLIKQLAKQPCTVIIGINTLFNHLLQHSKFKQLNFSQLKLVVSGGMPLQQTVAEKWQALTGISILEGYGLTEASPVVTINPVNLKKYTGSIGMPIPSTDIVIRDESEKNLTVGQVGELCIKGPQLMREYWNNPAETQQIFCPDGWLKTGDLGYFDEKGFFYLVDRKKDLIIVSGFNVYPNEIEKVLASHPSIIESAVIGVSCERTGEAIAAYIILKDSAVTAEDIISFCRERLVGYKIPKEIHFVEQLPKSQVGKILHYQLKSPQAIAKRLPSA